MGEYDKGATKRIHDITRPGISEKEVTDTYKQWAQDYDQDMIKAGFQGPQFGTALVCETLGDKKEARILDAACGTGAGGKQLKDLGFKHVDGLDASGDMLDVAKQSGVYERYIEAYMNKSRLPIEDDTYDLVVTVGSFVPGHVNQDCFEEQARIIKPGGYYCMAMCERYFSENPDWAGNIEPRMCELQETGVWTRISREVKPNYSGEHSGVMYVFRLEKDKNKALQSLQ